MKEAESRAQPKIHSKASTELRVVAVNCNPAPDAQDRLRRLMSILIRHAVKDRKAESVKGSLSEALPDNGGEDG